MKNIWMGALAGALAVSCQDRAVTATQAAHDDGAAAGEGPGAPAAPGNPSAPPPSPARSRGGSWGAVIDWPVVPIHSHLLPDGRVLTWGHSGDPTAWDPATGAFQAFPNPIDIFCGGHSLLADGTLLVTGGNISNDHGLPNANLFDFRAGEWRQGPQMARGRWYPTNTALPDGEMLVTSGEDETGNLNPIPEVWQLDGTWRELSSASLLVDYYPWMFVAPDGRVFYAGSQGLSRWLDTRGTGRWTNGPRHVAQINRGYGTAAMYDVGRILVAGGRDDPPVDSAETIDLDEPSPSWRATDRMIHARHHAAAIVLPDGTVLVTGGTSAPGKNEASGAVMEPEVWDPATGHWTALAPMSVKRLYHSTALLLPDARVLVAGGGQPAATGELDRFDAQLFSPPYLFNADGSAAQRPRISDAPSQVAYAERFLVSTSAPGAVGKVTLVKLGSMTHAFDQSQRFSRLAFTAGPGGLTVTAPANANLAPPGHYMLFLVGTNGAPSVARIVRLVSA
ncbi:MAG: galactose oxidase-like domain-containing protein [Myxococcales bacterium]